ncbi:hypothetical protein CPB86DRAFT_809541 [Serendipita vermifera]|nr:hypothetical protein CPB86DRAFT_809541 [Serendipita vermifera]
MAGYKTSPTLVDSTARSIATPATPGIAPILRRFIFAFFTAALLFVYFFTPTNTASSWNPFAVLKSAFNCHSADTMSNSHSAEGWHARATQSTTITPSTFKPKAEDVVVTFLYNAPADPDGFTLSLIKPNHAVDARGKILDVQAADFTALTSAVNAVKALPQSTEFGGQWRVKHARTSYPIDRILIKGEPERGVYGWQKPAEGQALELESPVGSYTTLPQELVTLVGLAREGRQGFTKGHADEAVIKKVEALHV